MKKNEKKNERKNEGNERGNERNERKRRTFLKIHALKENSKFLTAHQALQILSFTPVLPLSSFFFPFSLSFRFVYPKEEEKGRERTQS